MKVNFYREVEKDSDLLYPSIHCDIQCKCITVECCRYRSTAEVGGLENSTHICAIYVSF